MYELKIYRRVVYHGNEEWCKSSKRNWLVVSKLTWGNWQILTRVQKICTLIGSFRPKYIMF